MDLKQLKNQLRRDCIKQMPKDFVNMMKFFCTLIVFLSISLASSAQISLKIKNLTVRKSLQRIENVSNYKFFYSESLPDLDHRVTVNMKNASIDQVMTAILAGTSLTYENTTQFNVVLKHKEKTVSTYKSPESPNNGNKHKVTGKVVDAKGEPIIGATILEEGSSNGTVTDINGNFTLDISNGKALHISYLGYSPQRILVNGHNSVTVSLKEENKQLGEVIVVGYGTQRKATVTGSVSSVNSKDLIKAPVANIATGIAGKLPGLRVVSRSGEPGHDSPDIDIRGFGSALVVVDGVPSDFTQIDPNEIESITILKDASAAVYGVRAANGAVLITTKRGSEDEKTDINFSSTLSWQRPTIYPKLANAAQFVEMTDEDKVNRGQEPIYGAEELAKWKAGGEGYESYNWYDNMVKDWSPQQQYNVNVRGGSKRFKYFSSIGYLDQSGMWKSNSSNYTRFNFRSNVDADLGNGLMASLSISGRREQRNSPYASVTEIMSSIQRAYPTMRPYANDNEDYYALTNVPSYNPAVLSGKNAGYRKGDTKRFEGTAALKYDASQFVKGLSAKIQYSYFDDHYVQNQFEKEYNLYNYDREAKSYNIVYVGNSPSSLYRSWAETQVKNFQASLNYENTFANVHNIKALFLVETEQKKYQDVGAYREFLIDAIDEINTGIDANKNNDGTSWKTARIGYIGRLNYDYASRYLLEIAFREDASSKFAKNGRWGFFPEASLGWRITEEPFMKQQHLFDNLKLRFSLGKMGDDTDVSDYQYLSGYTYPANTYMFGSDVMKTLSPNGLANANITWYQATTYNLGLDFAMFNNRFNGSFDMFYRHRSDLLTTRAVQLPTTFGSALPQENLNTDNTKGFELVLNWADRINDFKYSVSGNISYTHSKYGHVERAESANSYLDWRNNTNYRSKNIMWGYKAIGQFQSYDEIYSSPAQDGKNNTTLRPGDIKYQDYNNDSVIDDNDVHVIGRDNTPEIFYGLTFNGSYKGFDLSVMLQGAGNFNVYNDDELQSPFFNGANSYVAFYNRWHHKDIYDAKSEWIKGKYPSTYASGLSNNTKTSTFWLCNASYLRLKELQIGYTLPNRLTNNWGIRNLRIFLSGFNLFTITDADLIDPEAASGRGRYYPQQKIISFGITFTL